MKIRAISNHHSEYPSALWADMHEVPQHFNAVSRFEVTSFCLLSRLFTFSSDFYSDSQAFRFFDDVWYERRDSELNGYKVSYFKFLRHKVGISSL